MGRFYPPYKGDQSRLKNSSAAGLGSEGHEFSSLIEQSRFGHGVSPKSCGPAFFPVLY